MFKDFSQNILKTVIGPKFVVEKDVDTAMTNLKKNLINADIHPKTANEILEKVKEEAVGKKVIKSLQPNQVIAKILHDQIVQILGETPMDFQPSKTILMIGLQGSGKTTSSAKLAYFMQQTLEKKVLLVSLDTHRPAAIEQLSILARDNNLNFFNTDFSEKQNPLSIAKAAMKESKNYDSIIFDTAGRIEFDKDLMKELRQIQKIVSAKTRFLVFDALIGQDAANIAERFHKQMEVTSTIFTRIDSDSRGGGILSIRNRTGIPIQFLASGEKIRDFGAFHPERIANRILDMGDLVSLVEQAESAFEESELEKFEKRLDKGKFNINDFSKAMKMMNKLGGMANIASMIPGLSGISSLLAESNTDDKVNKIFVIINSMTKEERRKPKIINPSRRKRIAKGAGIDIVEVNRFFKQYEQMAKMFKKVKSGKLDMESLISSMSNISR